MQEAKASFNGYFRSLGGNKDQFTLRQADNQTDKEFIARVNQFVKLLNVNGWVEWNGRDEHGSTGAGEQATGSNEVATRNGRELEVESIQLAAGGDHPRWVVRAASSRNLASPVGRKPWRLQALQTRWIH